MENLVLGLDFGTDSVRAIVAHAEDGEEVSSAVAGYRRWSEGLFCDASRNQFRQHPRDYMESMEVAVRDAVSQLDGKATDRIRGIGIDTTGSTPCPVDERGRPLALEERFAENPQAMFILWKDHTAVDEAEEINELAKGWEGRDFTVYSGGIYSSEWFWSKILHTVRQDPKIREAAFSWVEHCDWMPALLTGTESPEKMKRSRCAAGHKAMWHSEWGGLPDESFLEELDPYLSRLKRHLYRETHTADVPAGYLTEEWAMQLKLRPGIAVAVGAFDAHMGAVGGGIRPGVLTKIMGTSTCDMMVASCETAGQHVVEGICGQVDGSILPGMVGYEAGQSAFGDVYAWFKDLISWPLGLLREEYSNETGQAAEELEDRILDLLTAQASDLGVEREGLVALDWLNGRRTPYADQTLKGAVAGLSLGTTAPALFRALVESTVFGARTIADHFVREGLEIEEVIALGGIPQKNDFVMQLTADVHGMPIRVSAYEQTCALGAAMFGAVAAGLYETVEEAQEKMGAGFDRTFKPRPEYTAAYDRLYSRYSELGEDLSGFLKRM